MQNGNAQGTVSKMWLKILNLKYELFLLEGNESTMAWTKSQIESNRCSLWCHHLFLSTILPRSYDNQISIDQNWCPSSWQILIYGSLLCSSNLGFGGILTLMVSCWHHKNSWDNCAVVKNNFSSHIDELCNRLFKSAICVNISCVLTLNAFRCLKTSMTFCHQNYKWRQEFWITMNSNGG